MKFNTIIILTASLVWLISCSDTTENHQPESAQEVGKSEVQNEGEFVTLTPEQAKTINIEFVRMQRKELSNSIRASGILKVPNQNKAFVSPLVNGVVRSLNVEIGSYVKKGAPVATIYNPDLLNIQQQYQQLNIEIGLSETEVARQQELVEGNAAPLKNLQNARTNLEVQKNRRTSLRNQLTEMGASLDLSSNLIIRAPISGTVSEVSAQIGSSVSPGNPIAEIVNNSQMHLDLFVYEKDLPKLKLNQTIHFIITNNATKEYDATIFSIGSAFENDSKTIRVHADIEGDKTGLINGMNVSALISLDTSNLLAVPSDAIVSENGKDYIFVVINKVTSGSDGKGLQKQDGEVIVLRKIPVVKGTTSIGYSAITLLKEVPEDSQVVTKGAFFILGMLTNTEDHAH